MSKQLEALQRGGRDIKDMLVQAQNGDLYAASRFAVQQAQRVADETKLGVELLSSAIEGHLGNGRSVYFAVRASLRDSAEAARRLVDDAEERVQALGVVADEPARGATPNRARPGTGS